MCGGRGLNLGENKNGARKCFNEYFDFVIKINFTKNELLAWRQIANRSSTSFTCPYLDCALYLKKSIEFSRMLPNGLEQESDWPVAKSSICSFINAVCCFNSSV